MHQPRPYGRFADEAELTPEDAAAVERFARSLTNFQHASQLPHMQRARVLPSGRTAVAMHMGGTFRVVVYGLHEVPEPEPTGIATEAIPMLFSGVITRAQVREGEGVGMRLTEQTRRRLVHYNPQAALPAKDQELLRFRIEYAPAFRYFQPQFTGIYTFTQYAKQRPTWYSGAMAEVMQIIGGYGRQDLADLPDTPIERARMQIPEQWMREMRRELLNLRLPGYTGEPNREGQFSYDYKAALCHLVGFDSGGDPWLLQVDSRGVYAMPLPLIPATTTASFRAYVEERDDQELLTILNRFKGLPSGESFPQSSEAFEAWRRAGVIIRVCDTADFYTHAPFYEACGWAVNSRGTEAFNTCYSFAGNGLMHAHGYKMTLNLQPAAAKGLMPEAWQVDDEAAAQRLNAYLSALYQRLQGSTPRALAIKYKLRRHSAAEILARYGNPIQSEVAYWDTLEMAPIAPHSGKVARVTSGPLYWGLPYPDSQGRLKFPELTGQGCQSFFPHAPDYAGGPVRCDTVIFGCYVGDQLKVIKYFLDEREFQREEYSTFEEPMIVGAWEKEVTTGLSGLAGYCYTSDFDDRQELAPSVTTTTIVGRDMGYGTPLWSTPPLLFRVGSLSRYRYYSHTIHKRTKSGQNLDTGVCVPVFSRDSILYAFRESFGAEGKQEYNERHGMADPNSYQLWTHDSIFHYLGATQSGNRGEPRPRDGAPVWLDTWIYSPTPYSDFADQGDWMGLGSGVIDVTPVVGPYTSRGSTHHAGGVSIGGTPPPFEEYSWSVTKPGESAGMVGASLTPHGAVRVHSSVPDSWYFQYSPVEAGGTPLYFYRDMVRVTIGEADYCSVSEKRPDGTRTRWGHTALADHTSAHHFIGVINE